MRWLLPLRLANQPLRGGLQLFQLQLQLFGPGVLLDLMRLPGGADELAFPRWTLFKNCRSYRKDERHFLVCSLQYFALIGHWSGGCKNKNISKMSLLPQWSVATSTIIDHPQVYQAPLSPNAETQSAPTKRHKKLFHSCTLYHNHWEQKGAKNCWIPNQKHQPLTTMSDRLTMLASLTFQVLFVCLFNLLQWLSFKHASHHMKSQTGVKKTSFATTWFNLTISVVKLTTWLTGKFYHLVKLDMNAIGRTINLN